MYIRWIYGYFFCSVPAGGATATAGRVLKVVAEDDTATRRLSGDDVTPGGSDVNWMQKSTTFASTAHVAQVVATHAAAAAAAAILDVGRSHIRVLDRR